MAFTSRRVATLMVHTSPLDQAGTGDAGGMNIYVVEAAQNMAAMGVQVDIFTRRTNTQIADVVDVAPGVRVIQLNVGPVSGVTKEQLPKLIPELSEAFSDALSKAKYDIIHSHYWISGKVAMPVA
jgi:D-inositol-3-phosphate glycosyltransferase